MEKVVMIEKLVADMRKGIVGGNIIFFLIQPRVD